MRRLDAEVEARRDRERFKLMERQIQNMLVSSAADYRHIIRELDYTCKYSTPEKIEVVKILYDIKKKTGL